MPDYSDYFPLNAREARAQFKMLSDKLDAMQKQISALVANASGLSPAEQAKLNAIYETASKDSAKIDAAQKS